jgi:hypothetical protein
MRSQVDHLVGRLGDLKSTVSLLLHVLTSVPKLRKYRYALSLYLSQLGWISTPAAIVAQHDPHLRIVPAFLASTGLVCPRRVGFCDRRAVESDDPNLLTLTIDFRRKLCPSYRKKLAKSSRELKICFTNKSGLDNNCQSLRYMTRQTVCPLLHAKTKLQERARCPVTARIYWYTRGTLSQIPTHMLPN